MSLLFINSAIQLIDHKSKTVSCDLYEMLTSGSYPSSEHDHFDGQAFELANSHILSEKQKIDLVSERIVNQDSKSIKKKCEVLLQTVERQRKKEDEI